MAKAHQTKSTEYTAMVAEAEASVSAVKDPELRRVAFEKILVTLLERGQTNSGGQKRSPKSERAAPSAQKGAKRSVAAHGPKGHIEALIDDGFFEQQRTIAEVKAELANQGHHIALSSLSGPLQKLTQDHRLRRQRATARVKGSKATFVYSNW